LVEVATTKGWGVAGWLTRRCSGPASPAADRQPVSQTHEAPS
jgi:hypothetical protein